VAMPSLMSPREVLSVPGDVLKRDLEKNLGGTSLGRWGHVWAQKRQAVVLVPWDDPVRFMENPLIFVDETYDERAHVFAYGAIVVRPSEAITSTLWYLEGLLKIRAAWQAFWPSEVAPPRLHLRELFPEAARAKTRWAHLPGGDLTYVVTGSAWSCSNASGETIHHARTGGRDESSPRACLLRGLRPGGSPRCPYSSRCASVSSCVGAWPQLGPDLRFSCRSRQERRESWFDQATNHTEV
jgi:hypothetical protein